MNFLKNVEIIPKGGVVKTKKETVYWDANTVQDILPHMKTTAEEYFKSEDGIKKVLRSILKYGIGFVTNVRKLLFCPYGGCATH